MMSERLEKTLEGELLEPTEYFDLVNMGGKSVLKIISDQAEILYMEPYMFEKVDEDYVFYGSGANYRLKGNLVEEIKGKRVPDTDSFGILCHLNNGDIVLIYLMDAFSEENDIEDEDMDDEDEMMELEYIKDNLGESDISIEDIKKILDLDLAYFGENDGREEIVEKILNEFGIKIPLFAWSGMTEEELEDYYNELVEAKEKSIPNC